MNPTKPPSAQDLSAAGLVAVRSREVLSNFWTRLERVTLDYRRRNGEIDSQLREIYHRGNGAALLLFDPTRHCVVLVRQFRLAAWEIERGRRDDAGFLLEVPAGLVEDDEPKATVCREAWEETGIRVDDPQFLYTGFATPGAVTEQVHYFAAAYSSTDRTGDGGGLAEEGEDIEVLELHIDDAWARVQSGEIRDAKTILLLQHARLGPLSTC